LSFHPLVTVQDHLGTEWRIAADPDCDMAPLAIDQVKVEVPDIWPVLAMTDLGNLAPVIALDLPDRGWSIALDNKERICSTRLQHGHAA
jgi:hypothetical protein